MSMNLYFGMKLTQDMFDSIFNSDLIYFTKDWFFLSALYEGIWELSSLHGSHSLQCRPERCLFWHQIQNANSKQTVLSH